MRWWRSTRSSRSSIMRRWPRSSASSWPASVAAARWGSEAAMMRHRFGRLARMETSPTLRIAGLAATVAAGALLLAAALMGLSALGPGPSVGAVLLLVGALAGAPVVGLLGWRAVASGRRAVQAEPAALLGALT